jgi:hypothetical protein
VGSSIIFQSFAAVSLREIRDDFNSSGTVGGVEGIGIPSIFVGRRPGICCAIVAAKLDLVLSHQ